MWNQKRPILQEHQPDFPAGLCPGLLDPPGHVFADELWKLVGPLVASG